MGTAHKRNAKAEIMCWNDRPFLCINILRRCIIMCGKSHHFKIQKPTKTGSFALKCVVLSRLMTYYYSWKWFSTRKNNDVTEIRRSIWIGCVHCVYGLWCSNNNNNYIIVKMLGSSSLKCPTKFHIANIIIIMMLSRFVGGFGTTKIRRNFSLSIL